VLREEKAVLMAKAKWYSPQLSREVVSRLYHRAKAERLSMTVLANQILDKELRTQERNNTQRVMEEQQITRPK